MSNAAQGTLLFDFATDAGRAGWQATHDLAPLMAAPDGLALRATGGDPYAVGPAVATPAGKPLWLTLRLRSTQTGMGQVFFWAPGGAGPTERDSVRFPVRAERWETIRVALPPLAERTHFRIDPPGEAGGVTVLASMRVSQRVEYVEPRWTPPSARPVTRHILRSGPATLRCGALGVLALSRSDTLVATGNDRPLLGYQTSEGAPLQWLDLSRPTATVQASDREVSVRVQASDADGGKWTVAQRFQPGRDSGTFEIVTSLSVDRERWLVHAPGVILHPIGTGHDQAILCGVEYLDRNEPSSSEADLAGEQARRQIPDPHQLTIPMMAILRGGFWVSLEWAPEGDVAACFDSPDRRMGSGGHLLGLLFPDGHRAPGHLLPTAARALKAGETLSVRAIVRTGEGARSILPAVQAWVGAHGLPKVPVAGSTDNLLRLAAAGWLDSRVREGARYRHAYPGDFGAQPAADAAACQEWLATRLPARASELRQAARAARGLLSPGESGGVGHIPTLAPALAYRGVERYLAAARQEAQALLDRFEPGGMIRYRATPGRPDFGRTHFAPDANGLTGQVLAALLTLAARLGEPEVTREALRRLRQLDARFRNTVPRGAQTWEVPLHTPDILASAHLVKAFVLGWELSGDAALLDAARHWAWTGVPFVYLTPPTTAPVGLYGTTPVLGATHWEAPNWIGLPVQWCGLVYADALLDLADHEPTAPWRRLAEGIVASGWQQTHPLAGRDASEGERARQGLLPDSFNLTAQIRNDVAINPATLLVPTARVLDHPLYTRRALRPGGVLVHAPGEVRRLADGRLQIRPWTTDRYEVLLTGSSKTPRRVFVNGQKSAFRYRLGGGWQILGLKGEATIKIQE